MSEWQAHIDYLLSGPYAGWGGMTALAKHLGASRPTVWRWQQRCNTPRGRYQRRLARLAKRPRPWHHK